jgi:hypothetical protein
VKNWESILLSIFMAPEIQYAFPALQPGLAVEQIVGREPSHVIARRQLVRNAVVGGGVNSTVQHLPVPQPLKHVQ